MAPELIIVLTGILVAVPCALVGSLLVLRRMAMMGDAISHAVLPGIAIAFLLAGGPSPIPVLIGASAVGLLTVVLVEALHRSRRVKEDAAIGLVFPALFALGVVLVARFGKQVHLDTQHVLYGEIAYAPWDTLIVGGMALGPKPFWVLGFVTLVNLAFVLRFYKELKLATFDPGLAAALGFSPALIHYLLMGTVSMTTVAAFDSVGAILVVALLIVPPAAAYLLTDRLSVMLALSAGLGALSAVLGYLLARAVDGSIAGAMATAAGLLFVAAFLASPRHGALAWLARQARLRRRFAADMLVLHLAQYEEDEDVEAISTAPVPTGSAPAPADPESLPGAALRERFRWSPSFTRAAVREALSEGLVRVADRDGDGGSAPPDDLSSLIVTQQGRLRVRELIAS